MATKIQLRRDSAANWSAQNPILSEGELGYDTTNAKAKVGDGVQNWSALPFITDSPNSALTPGDDVSELNNDAGYITATALDIYSTTTEMNAAINTATTSATANSNNWDTAYGWGDHSVEGYLTTHQDLTGYATEAWVGQQGYLTTHQDLTGYATETYVNSQGFLTAHQDISGKADITYVDTKVADLVDSAPGALDTLNELAAALGDDPNFATTINNNIATKWTQDNAKITNWDTAYGWGDHSVEGYLTNADLPDLTGYATETWVGQQGYLTAVPAGYATETWVGDQNYLTSVSFADLTDKTITDYKQSIHYIGTTSGAFSLDKANGSVQHITATGSLTLSHNLSSGQTMNVIVNHTSTNGTISISNGLWAYSDNTLQDNGVSIITLFYDGSNTYASINKGFAAV